MTALRELAHARAGDKGGTADLTVIAVDATAYARLRRQLTAPTVQRHFEELPVTRVDRYEVPHLLALKFVLHDALGAGVTASLALDPHGKSLSSSLLAIDLPDDPPEDLPEDFPEEEPADA